MLRIYRSPLGRVIILSPGPRGLKAPILRTMSSLIPELAADRLEGVCFWGGCYSEISTISCPGRLALLSSSERILRTSSTLINPPLAPLVRLQTPTTLVPTRTQNSPTPNNPQPQLFPFFADAPALSPTSGSTPMDVHILANSERNCGFDRISSAWAVAKVWRRDRKDESWEVRSAVVWAVSVVPICAYWVWNNRSV